jgi:hypothetical protein
MQTLFDAWTGATVFMAEPAEIRRLTAEDPREGRERPRALFATHAAHENEEESIGGYR